jgi:hypothetical protein
MALIRCVIAPSSSGVDAWAQAERSISNDALALLGASVLGELRERQQHQVGSGGRRSIAGMTIIGLGSLMGRRTVGRRSGVGL